MKLPQILALPCLLVTFSVHAVIIDDRDWRQVTDTVGISYAQMAGVCDVTTGYCNGSVGSVDMTGWIWADDVAIAALFEGVTGAPAGTFDVEQFNYTVNGATWADDFIDDDNGGPDTGLFAATIAVSATDHGVFGLTRHTVAGAADRSYIRLVENDLFGDANTAIVGNPVGFDISRSHTGHWLYKDLSVPAPGGLLLLGLGLLTLRRSRASSSIRPG